MGKITSATHELESWQIDDATRLRAIFERCKAEAKAAGDRFTQETFAEASGISSANMVWQYLSAHRPLNIQAAAKFAKGLGVQVDEFSPTLAAQIDQVAEAKGPSVVEAPLPAKAPQRLLQWIDIDEASLLSNFRATDDAGRSAILGLSELVPRVMFDELANHKAKAGRD